MKKHHQIFAAIMRKLILGCICLFLCVSSAHMIGAAADTPPSDLPVLESPLAAGLADYYAIRADGTLIMWGLPEYGDYGEGIPFDKAITLLSSAAGVYTSGRGDVLAVDREGTLWSNSARFLEVIPGFELDQDRPMILHKVMGDVSMAAAGQFHSVVLKRDGTVWVQGFGKFGAPWLGGTPYLVQVMEDVTWVGVTDYGGYAVTAGHELWGWGLTDQDTAAPRKLMDGVYQVGSMGTYLTTLTEDGDLLRWGTDSMNPEVLLSGVALCGTSYAIRQDGSLWIGAVGYGTVAANDPGSCFKVMEQAAYACQGEQTMLALDGNGRIWLLAENAGPIQLGGGFYTAEKTSGLQNFAQIKQYSEDIFEDVTERDWFSTDVKAVYEVDLMEGKGDRLFAPNSAITTAEAVTVAARVRDTYYGGQTDFTGTGAWYQPYADYAQAHGIIKEAPDNWGRPATRAEFASMLATVLPERELDAINANALFTDVDEAHLSYAAIMTLSRAGIMQGKGGSRFDPDAPVKRSEAAAMLARCVRPEQRIAEV